MSSEALGNERRASTPEPHSENNSAANEDHRLLKEDVQEDYCWEEESEVNNALKAGGREGEGITRGHESRVRETRRKISGLKR